MNTINKFFWLPAVCIMLGSLGLSAQTVLSVQSPARPLGMDISSPVYQAGSDAASAVFQSTLLQGLTGLNNPTTLDLATLPGVNNSVRLDSGALTIKNAYDIRAYFVSEEAFNQNTLYFKEATPGGSTVREEIVFPNASSPDSGFLTGETGDPLSRTESAPLLPGDFVQFGTFNAGNVLTFGLIQQGAVGQTSIIFSSDPSLNPDSINHTAIFALAGSPYLVVGFEDLYGGGDLDFDDPVFVFDIGAANVNAILTPEPSTWAILFSLIACVIFVHWRRSRSRSFKEVIRLNH